MHPTNPSTPTPTHPTNSRLIPSPASPRFFLKPHHFIRLWASMAGRTISSILSVTTPTTTLTQSSSNKPHDYLLHLLKETPPVTSTSSSPPRQPRPLTRSPNKSRPNVSHVAKTLPRDPSAMVPTSPKLHFDNHPVLLKPNGFTKAWTRISCASPTTAPKKQSTSHGSIEQMAVLSLASTLSMHSVRLGGKLFSMPPTNGGLSKTVFSLLTTEHQQWLYSLSMNSTGTSRPMSTGVYKAPARAVYSAALVSASQRKQFMKP